MTYLGNQSCQIFELAQLEFNTYITKFGRVDLANPKTVVCHIPSLNEPTLASREKFFGRKLAHSQFVIATLSDEKIEFN